MNKALEYLANMLYQIDARKDGFKPWAWLVLPSETRDLYVAQAKILIDEWDKVEQERATERSEVLHK